MRRTDDDGFRNQSSESSSQVFSDATQRLIDTPLVTTDITALHQKVWKRIQDLENEIRALKTCHNMATVTCRLPIEILSRIFLFLAFSEPRASPSSSETSKAYHWIPATHVCRYWRSISIDCAGLWTHLDFEQPTGLVALALERSKGAPLDVLCRQHMIPLTNAGVLDEALSQVKRIRSLTISDGDKRGSDAACNLVGTFRSPQWAEDVPVLQELDIRIGGHASAFSLPKGFLGSGVSNLTSLKYYAPHVEWKSLPLGPNLTVLDLMARSMNPPITPEVFIDTFRQMPLLHTLLLRWSLGFRSSVQQALQRTGISPLTFPTLRRLEMEDDPKTIDDFLTLTRSPTVVSVSLKSVSDSMPAEVIERSLYNMLTFWCCQPRQSKPYVRRLKLARYASGAVELDFDVPIANDTTTFLEGDKHMLFHFGRDTSLRSRLGILENLFDFRTLASLTNEEAPDIMYAEEWRFFSCLPSLAAISLEGPLSEEIEHLFNVLQQETSLGKSQLPPFPSLSTIVLSDFYLDEELGMNLEYFMADFTIILRSRALASCPIKSLQLEGVDQIGEAEINRLREADPGLVVVLDGLEYPPS